MKLFPPDLFLCYFKRHCATWTGKRNTELIKDKMRTARIKQIQSKCIQKTVQEKPKGIINAIIQSSNQGKWCQGFRVLLGKNSKCNMQISCPTPDNINTETISSCKTDNNISTTSIPMLSVYFLIVSSFLFQSQSSWLHNIGGKANDKMLLPFSDK